MKLEITDSMVSWANGYCWGKGQKELLVEWEDGDDVATIGDRTGNTEEIQVRPTGWLATADGKNVADLERIFSSWEEAVEYSVDKYIRGRFV